MKILKQKNLAIIGLSVIITGAVIFFIIKPTVEYIQDTKDQIKIEREDLERRYQRVMYLRQNADKLKEIEKQLVVLDDLFLVNDQELDFITTLEGIADKNNVRQKISLKSANLNDPEQNILPFSVLASGEMHDVLSYLLGIEQLSYYVNFNSLTIDSKISDKKLDAMLNGKVYILK